MTDNPKPLSSITRARKLRRDSTVPERVLWSRLRARRLAGLKFRRQHPFGPYVLDFYCESTQFTIELDGDSHIGQAAYDLDRQSWIESQGVRVLRVGNDDVLRDLDTVLEAILIACRIPLDQSRP